MDSLAILVESATSFLMLRFRQLFEQRLENGSPSAAGAFSFPTLSGEYL
jgi:hypothetical protein